jgi:hypothetical protein
MSTTQSVSGRGLPKVVGTSSTQSATLPITHSLTLAYFSSFVIALLMAVTSITGLLYQTRIYPTDEALYQYVATDVLNLVVGLPALFGSMWLARRGKLIGLLCWPGMLLYGLFVYVMYAIGVPFGPLFLPYLVLAVLSAYTTVGFVASVDSEAIRCRLTGAVPERLAGGILTGLSTLYSLNAVGQIVTALASQTPIGATDIAHWMADLAILGPMWLVGGLLLWRREALGYVAGTGLLLLGSILFIGVVPIIVFEALYTASPIDVAAIVQMLVMGLVCFVPFGLYVRGIVQSERG